MRPTLWQPPVVPSAAEQAISKQIRRAKLFVFLREQRHELLSEAFQAELAPLYQDSPLGQPPIPPTQLALATILQAYTGVSEAEVIEATPMDRRWQLVLDGLDCHAPPFSKGTLIAFRQRLIGRPMDRRLIERSIELAAERRACGSRQLRAALDSRPLWGTSRVEDTSPLLGHARPKALGVIARQQGRELATIAVEAGAGMVGGTSLKAALDLDWDAPSAREQALVLVLGTLEAVERWLESKPTGGEEPGGRESLAAAPQVRTQDVELAADTPPMLRRKVAKDRRSALEDHEMRHGRKRKHQRIDGYKRHVLRDLDSGLGRSVGVTSANVPEARVTEAIMTDLAAQSVQLSEVHIDRAYLRSLLVRERPPELMIDGKAWPVRNAGRFPKTAFVLDWQRQLLRCPANIEVPVSVGWDCPLSRSDLCDLPNAGALYHQRSWAERVHPS